MEGEIDPRSQAKWAQRYVAFFFERAKLRGLQPSACCRAQGRSKQLVEELFISGANLRWLWFAQKCHKFPYSAENWRWLEVANAKRQPMWLWAVFDYTLSVATAQ